MIANTDFSINSDFDLESCLQKFCNILKEAAENCTPNRKAPRKRRLWSQNIQQLMLDNKKIFYKWKHMGRPGPEHPISIKRKVAKKELRTAQRKLSAERRAQNYKNIMNSSTNDMQMFYSLIAKG